MPASWALPAEPERMLGDRAVCGSGEGPPLVMGTSGWDLDGQFMMLLFTREGTLPDGPNVDLRYRLDGCGHQARPCRGSGYGGGGSEELFAGTF